MIGIGINLWRRGGGSGIETYTHQLSDTADDGREYAGSWHTTAPLIIWDTTGVYSDLFTVGLSFPAVNISGGVASATLAISISAETNPGAWDLYAESNVAAASSQWGAVNLPSAATKTTASVTSNSTVVGAYNIDVTALVSEVVAGAAWNSGQRINFILQAQLGGFSYCTLRAVPDSASATLSITGA